jgi:two-component system OmpR family response regulator
VHLTTGEFELLDALVNHPNWILSRDQLLDLSRHRLAGPFDRTIDVQVGRLRRKLGDDPKNPMLIKTVRGGGYMFSPLEIRERETSDQSVSAQPGGISSVVGSAA